MVSRLADLRLHRVLCLLVIMIGGLAGSLCGNAADAAKANPEPTGYTNLEYRMLKASIEEYNNKKVSYEGRFLEFSATFPKYIEESGFKANTYFLLAIQDSTVFVMVKKTDDMNALIGGLKRGQQVKVFGRVKRFRRAPEKTKLPRYYVELDELRLMDTANEGIKPPLGGAHGK